MVLSLVPETNPVEKSSGEAYLRLTLNSQIEAVLPMSQIQAVLLVPIERITPIPNMPECVLGLLHQRSRVFWTLNLPQLLELPPLDINAPIYNVVIVRVDNIPLGLVIPEIKGVIRFSQDAIESPIGTVMPGIVPYLSGCVLRSPEEILLVLDPQAIANSSILQN